jgi:hypothetical protein
MPEALTTHPQDYPRHPPVDRSGARRRRPIVSAERLREVGRALRINGRGIAWKNTAGREVEHMVLGGLERAEHQCTGTGRARITSSFTIIAVDGVRRALATARVGGPETAGGPGGTFLAGIPGALRARHELRQRPDRLAAGLCVLPRQGLAGVHERPRPHGHGQPVQKHRRRLCTVIASFPEFKKLPVVIGESDPEGCAACREPRDAYRNGTVYCQLHGGEFSARVRTGRNGAA